MNRMTKNFSFLDDKDDVVLNLVARSNWSQSEPQPFSGSFQKELESQLYHLEGGLICIGLPYRVFALLSHFK